MRTSLKVRRSSFFHGCLSTYQMPDCQQVLSSDGVSARTRDLSHCQRKAQEQKHTQTLYLQLINKTEMPLFFFCCTFAVFFFHFKAKP